MQSGKYCSGNSQTQTRTALKSSGGVFYTTASDALHLVHFVAELLLFPVASTLL
ncbi:unnamed protein product [Staurois parvus]|uniref:Uncharacterized protein n=1 Tax=Staurois parvus TaxID=386267 RepID=A0ABN9HH27_9NEOB|nr:unnamed protein product [Staurois parvus]